MHGTLLVFSFDIVTVNFDIIYLLHFFECHYGYAQNWWETPSKGRASFGYRNIHFDDSAIMDA